MKEYELKQIINGQTAYIRDLESRLAAALELIDGAVEQIVREWKELKLYKKATQDKESERERQVAAAEQIKETYGYEVINLQRKLVVANEKIAELELYKKATQAVQGAVDKTANEVIQQLRDRLAAAREGLEEIQSMACDYNLDVVKVAQQTLEKMTQKGE